jgi:hypothetical protein
VLARYSGEFTVFRELLQNSDDARSEEVQIIFETQPAEGKETGGEGSSSSNQHDVTKPLPDLKTVLVRVDTECERPWFLGSGADRLFVLGASVEIPE